MLLFGLASNGVYMCPPCYQEGGSLLHCPSTLTSQRLAVHFCCTFLGVTSTGRYPASCPVKPGLSSSGTFRPASRDHLSYLQFVILPFWKKNVKVAQQPQAQDVSIAVFKPTSPRFHIENASPWYTPVSKIYLPFTHPVSFESNI